jgi:hypothetical protein
MPFARDLGLIRSGAPASTTTPKEHRMTHAVLTGPIQGAVVLEDGTKVDVSPQIIYVDTEAEAAEVADLVARRYVAEGHPAVEGDFEYVKDPEAVLAAADNTDPGTEPTQEG